MPSTAPRQPQDSCPHAWSPNIPKTAQTSLCVTGGRHAHHWEMGEAGHMARLVSSGARTAACSACYGSSRARHRLRHTLCTSPLRSSDRTSYVGCRYCCAANTSGHRAPTAPCTPWGPTGAAPTSSSRAVCSGSNSPAVPEAAGWQEAVKSLKFIF